MSSVISVEKQKKPYKKPCAIWLKLSDAELDELIYIAYEFFCDTMLSRDRIAEIDRGTKTQILVDCLGFRDENAGAAK